MNNLGILKKVAAALAEENPKLDYVRGMIDTLIEMREEVKLPLARSLTVEHPAHDGGDLGSTPSAATKMDEAAMLDAQAKAALAKTMELAAKSQEL